MSDPRQRVRAALKTAPRDWYTIRNAADGTTAELMIYGEIGFSFWDDSVTAQNLVNELNDITADAITVRINSPGGDYFDGLAILNALRGHKAKITTVIEGIAASAASFIAMGGDEIVMKRNAELMIHDASTVAIGNASDMRELADRLDQVSDNIASIYNDRAGGGVAKWRTAMTAETWYSDKEALDAGLVDRIDAGSKAADPKNKFDLSIFNYAGRQAAPTPPIFDSGVTPSAAEAEADKKESHMATLQEALAERLGIPADADEDTALAALDEALAEQAVEPVVPAVAPTVEPAEPTPEQIAAYANKAGLLIVDKVQYENAVQEASLGRKAYEKQISDSNDSFLDDAIKDGRIAPANREHFLNLLTDNPEGTRTLINQLPKGLVPLEAVGHGQSIENSAEEDLGWFNTRSKEV
ncbi:hypothetical protein CH274_13250 [Rhodococcus sp. 06-418-5]|uniref:head maturation protease, ClpP-related n=1 Tax=Rhodococcus sp. 06-418-5 TaxID=2022507 RepID=UPI000B9A74F2|nr:head maturation protease, ClpP-related [Rhodococcus sp. 06-418-5]OZC80197.1 hypothetical protein CH274_13250 [Rhodococcus sp. 06-418-5]